MEKRNVEKIQGWKTTDGEIYNAHGNAAQHQHKLDSLACLEDMDKEFHIAFHDHIHGTGQISSEEIYDWLKENKTDLKEILDGM